MAAGCARAPDAVRLSGGTMGTTWNVTYIDAAGGLSPELAQQGIQQQLDRVNASMSTYLPESEISRFNSAAPGASITMSPAFAEVLHAALEIGRLSAGAYDVTVGPLVDLWGFGASGGLLQAPPADSDIAAARQRVGADKLALEGDILRKTGPVSLDFSSIAKGYAVDRVAQWLVGQGVADFLVEVGGEMRLAGHSPRGDLWRVAVEKPEAGGRSVDLALALTDSAVATSGDYRNYFEADGRLYSHSIDPRTGYPIDHDLVSVTVIADTAMHADAWATALTVMGHDAALALAQEQGLAVYLIRRVGDNLVHSHSAAFRAYLPAQGTQNGGSNPT